MIGVNLTTFVEVATKTGLTKLNAVRRLKERGEYRPAADFYRPLREAIIDCHRHGREKHTLDDVMVGITHRNKRTAYPPIIAAYKRWWGRKDLEFFEPPSRQWRHGNVRVRISPELGLIAGEERLAIKLYFKKDAITKRQSDVVLHLLQSTIGSDPEIDTVGLLDIRRRKLLVPTVEKGHLEAALRAEAGYIESAWEEL